MSYVILRTAKLKTIGNIAASGHHTFRERDTPNADAKRTALNIVSGAGNTADLLNAVRARLPEKHRKDAVLCIEYLISASPDWFGDDWREKKQHGTDYFASALDWLKDRHGAENVVCANVQLDEKSPHMVVYVVPRLSDGRLSAKEFVGGRAKLSAMQTNFAKEVGQQHGLERGIEGSKARHTTVKNYYTRANTAFEPLPEVNTVAPKLREKPTKPGFFAYGDIKKDYQNDHDTWMKEKAVADNLAEQRRLEITAQRDAAVATARRHEAQAKEAEALKVKVRELKASNGGYAKKVANLEDTNARLKAAVSLFTPAEIKLAQQRKQQQDAEKARQVELARQKTEELARQKEIDRVSTQIAEEFQNRVAGIQKLFALAGADYSFAVNSSEALRKAGNDPAKVDWRVVEAQTMREAIGEHGQTAESVIKALTRHSPGCADPASHQEIHDTVNRAAPRLEARYEKNREQEQDRDDELDRG